MAKQMPMYRVDGVQNWQPPPGFKNPVPPARGDSTLVGTPVPPARGDSELYGTPVPGTSYDAMPAGSIRPIEMPNNTGRINWPWFKLLIGAVVLAIIFAPDIGRKTGVRYDRTINEQWQILQQKIEDATKEQS
jgi:hypothetical protein